MNNHLDGIRNSFNGVHHTYDANGKLQKTVGLKLIDHLIQVRMDCKDVADFGCGTGLVTELLIGYFKNFNKLYCVDIAKNMLLKASQRLKECNAIFENVDFNSFRSIHKFDLIFSNMALQWSLDFDLTLDNIFNLLNRNGILAFTIPLYQSFHELKPYSLKPFMKLEDVCDILNKQGFKIIYSATESIIEKYDLLLQALKGIKLIGANYYQHRALSADAGYEIIKNHGDLMNSFDLTYNVGYFIAMK